MLKNFRSSPSDFFARLRGTPRQQMMQEFQAACIVSVTQRISKGVCLVAEVLRMSMPGGERLFVAIDVGPCEIERLVSTEAGIEGEQRHRGEVIAICIGIQGR